MRFLLEENFPKAVIPVLDAMGHEVVDFRLLGTIGAPAGPSDFSSGAGAAFRGPEPGSEIVGRHRA